LCIHFLYSFIYFKYSKPIVRGFIWNNRLLRDYVILINCKNWWNLSTHHTKFLLSTVYYVDSFCPGSNWTLRSWCCVVSLTNEYVWIVSKRVMVKQIRQSNYSYTDHANNAEINIMLRIWLFDCRHFSEGGGYLSSNNQWKMFRISTIALVLVTILWDRRDTQLIEWSIRSLHLSMGDIDVINMELHHAIAFTISSMGFHNKQLCTIDQD
jgi:hypothetical protein